MRLPICALALATTSLLAGCADLGGPPPARPHLDVADQVQKIDRGLVVGTWTCREMNSYPEVPAHDITLTYAQDGSLRSEARAPATPPLGPMNISSTGTWNVAGDRIVTADVETKVESDDAFTNTMAGIATSIANSWSSPEKQGSGDVLELTAHRMVLRPVGVDDPPTIACSR